MMYPPSGEMSVAVTSGPVAPGAMVLRLTAVPSGRQSVATEVVPLRDSPTTVASSAMASAVAVAKPGSGCRVVTDEAPTSLAGRVSIRPRTTPDGVMPRATGKKLNGRSVMTPSAETVRATLEHCSTTVPASLIASAVSELVGQWPAMGVTDGDPAAAVTVAFSERPSTTPAPLSATGPVPGVHVHGLVSPLCGRPPSSVSTPAPAQTRPRPTRGCHEEHDDDGFV